LDKNQEGNIVNRAQPSFDATLVLALKVLGKTFGGKEYSGIALAHQNDARVPSGAVSPL